MGLHGTKAILLDFDGPVCGVFSGFPAHDVAASLVKAMSEASVDVPERIAVEPDPLEVLRYAATLGRPDILMLVEDNLRAAELIAVASAEPTVGASQVMESSVSRGLRVAVVSNNSAQAIDVYLSMHHLTHLISAVVGREYANPDAMKPNPQPVHNVVSQLGLTGAECVLVGDSTTDVVAANAAEVSCIGYANKTNKRADLASVGAIAIIESMYELADELARVH